MSRIVTSAVTGAAVAAAVGTAAYMMSAKSMGAQRRKFKRSAGRAIRTMGDIIGNVSQMIK